MSGVVLLFASNSGTMIATKALRDAGVTARMIPTPTSVQSASNLCLCVDGSLESEAVGVLKAANVAISGVHR